jgi:hypothetical protein
MYGAEPSAIIFLETAPSFIIHCHGYNNQLATLARGSWGQQSPRLQKNLQR